MPSLAREDIRAEAARRLSRVTVMRSLRSPQINVTMRTFQRAMQMYFARQRELTLFVLGKADKVTDKFADRIMDWKIEKAALAEAAEEFIAHAVAVGHKNAVRLVLGQPVREAADPEDAKYLQYLKAAEYVESKPLQLADDVSNTTKAAIQGAIADGLREGEAVRDIAKRIEVVFDAADSERAKLIAETEVMDALNHAAATAYEELGVQKHEWIRSGAERYCSNGACPQNDGAIVKIGEEFPSGHTRPVAHPRCQCVTGPVME